MELFVLSQFRDQFKVPLFLRMFIFWGW